MGLLKNEIFYIVIIFVMIITSSLSKAESEEATDRNEIDGDNQDKSETRSSGITLFFVILGIVVLALLVCHIIIVVRNCISYAVLPTYLEDNCLCQKVMMLHPRYDQDPSSDV